MKRWLVGALTAPGVCHVFEPWTRKRTPILMLHRFSEQDGQRDYLSRRLLEECIAWISRSGLRAITLAAWCRAVVEGEWPARTICLTVDDGYLDFKEIAFPVLRASGVPATVFVASRFIDGDLWYWWDRIEYVFSQTRRHRIELPWPGHPIRLEWTSPGERAAAFDTLTEALKSVPNETKLSVIREVETLLEVDVPARPVGEYRGMTWEDLRDLTAQGIEFGGHTATHPVLSRVSDADAAREVTEGIETIERHVGARPTTFAYPNGRLSDFTPAVVKALRVNGIIGAVLGTGGIASPAFRSNGEDSMYLLPRVAMPSDLSYFVQHACGLEAFKQDLLSWIGRS